MVQDKQEIPDKLNGFYVKGVMDFHNKLNNEIYQDLSRLKERQHV